MHRWGTSSTSVWWKLKPIAGALRFELLSEGQVIPRGRKHHHIERSPQRAAERPRHARSNNKGNKRDKTRKPERKKTGKSKRGK